jgi:hypothetical protein
MVINMVMMLLMLLLLMMMILLLPSPPPAPPPALTVHQRLHEELEARVAVHVLGDEELLHAPPGISSSSPP